MAIINKINEKSTIVVSVIAIGLVLFLLGGDFFSSNSFLFSNRQNVGEIAGTDIAAQEYSIEMQRQEYEFQRLQGKSPSPEQLQQQVWQELIDRNAYQKQYEKLGLTVTADELVEMVQGNFLHSIVKSFLGGNDPSFDKDKSVQILSNIDQYGAEAKAQWELLESKLPGFRIKEKYLNLFKKTEYVTQEEAKRYYVSQNEKAEVKYLYVPFHTIPDSTIKVTDDEIKAYIDGHKDEYKVDESRSLDYVIFKFVPSSEDSAVVRKEMLQIAQEFKVTDNDSAFVQRNSDNPSDLLSANISQLPESLKANASVLVVDSVYGPYVENGKYVLHKVVDKSQDTVYSARASHILFRANEGDEEGKKKSKKEAEDILKQIQAGANFEEMAKKYGTDGTAPKGGDLGWFGKGQMVKPFEDAVFGATKEGVLPKIVETQFGFHLLKITGAKNNQKFKVATINKDLMAFEATRDEVYRKAEAFAASVKDTASFNAAVKKDSTLTKLSFEQVDKNSRSLTSLNNARELVRWSFNDAEVGDISPVMTIDDQYVVAVLTGKREEGTATVDQKREEVKVKVINEKKFQQITDKLKTLSGDFAKIAADYGPNAQTGVASEITLNGSSMQGVGYDPATVGRVFGMKEGQKIGPVKGENGVVMLEFIKKTPAPEIADYNQFKTQLLQQRSGRTDYQVDEAVKEHADITDNRYKYY